MAIITDLTIQKRDPERVNVFLDGKFAFGLAYAIAAELTIGQALSAEELRALQNRERLARAKKNALKYVSLRPRSEFELRTHLRKKEFEAHEIDEVVTHLRALRLLDDVEFAHYWVEQRETFRPRSRMALSHELRQKGVSREIIEAALEQVDEAAAAQRMAEKRAAHLAGLPEQEFRMKLAGYLQRRGFSYEIIREVLDNTWQSYAEE